MTNIKDNQEDNKYAGYIKNNMQVNIEYNKNLLAAACAASHELTKKVTDICATNLTLGKSFLKCASFEDIINWGEKAIQSNLETYIQSAGSIYSKACSEVTKANSNVTKKINQNISSLKNEHK